MPTVKPVKRATAKRKTPAQKKNPKKAPSTPTLMDLIGAAPGFYGDPVAYIRKLRDE